MMESSRWLLICSVVFLNGGTEQISGMVENKLADLGNSRILQQLRPKRSAKDDCCKKSGQAPPIIVNHYHNYYYNCPCMPQPTPKATSGVCSPDTKCIDCTCDKSGSISCSVPQSSTNNYPQSNVNSYQRSPQTGGSVNRQPSPASQTSSLSGGTQTKDIANKDKNTAFSFSMLFDDPIAKDFYDFVTNNFVKREIPLAITEVKCLTDPISVLEDPICKEFFNLFTQSFVRKPENSTVNPGHSKSVTLKPTQAPSSRRP